MFKINRREILDYSLEDLWGVLSSFEDYTWNRGIKKSEKIGKNRYKVTSNGGYSIIVNIIYVKKFETIGFNLDDKNIGVRARLDFAEKNKKTELKLTAKLKVKKFYLKPFVKGAINRQEAIFLEDLKKRMDGISD